MDYGKFIPLLRIFDFVALRPQQLNMTNASKTSGFTAFVQFNVEGMVGVHKQYLKKWWELEEDKHELKGNSIIVIKKGKRKTKLTIPLRMIEPEYVKPLSPPPTIVEKGEVPIELDSELRKELLRIADETSDIAFQVSKDSLNILVEDRYGFKRELEVEIESNKDFIQTIDSTLFKESLKVFPNPKQIVVSESFPFLIVGSDEVLYIAPKI